MNDIREFAANFKNIIKNAENIGIVGHMSPDGDAIGSALGLYDAVLQLNNNSYVLKIDEIPEYLNFLPGLDKFTEYSGEKYDVLITVDASSSDRIGDAVYALENCRQSIVIDHHISNEKFGDINHVVADASSTSEVVFDLIEELGLSISEDMASCIFVGILTDTNRFLYSNSSSNTLRAAAKLMDTGFDKDYILYNLYQTNTMGSFRLTQKVIENTEFCYDDKAAIAVIDNDMLNICGADKYDIEDKINLIRDIRSVELACLIKEVDDDIYKVSLRSKRFVDVSKICTEYGGGGHIHAGGFSFRGNLSELKTSLIKRFDEIDWSKI
ncbi:MAG: bifunctional oligoribonuclease/PAP phosphatase NrnA [Tissierellia bacterium]|nr:bifunctional oligoribonuclease/PAP phosphatase NrnA [Tissierellia bacterium]